MHTEELFFHQSKTSYVLLEDLKFVIYLPTYEIYVGYN